MEQRSLSARRGALLEAQVPEGEWQQCAEGEGRHWSRMDWLVAAVTVLAGTRRKHTNEQRGWEVQGRRTPPPSYAQSMTIKSYPVIFMIFSVLLS